MHIPIEDLQKLLKEVESFNFVFLPIFFLVLFSLLDMLVLIKYHEYGWSYSKIDKNLDVGENGVKHIVYTGYF